MNDEQGLIQRLQDPATRRAAFEEMVNRYNRKLYWQIRHIVVDHDDTDDVLQNVFLKSWSSLDTFKGESQVSTWLFRIAYNESITFLKKKKNQLSLDNIDDGVANTLISDEYFDGDETQIMLQQAIESLPDKQRAVFTMKYYDEKKYEEIAEITGTSVGALKASYHIAVQKISNFFKSKE